ncbi:MAG: universal stress protein, partial [Mycobacterium sp.]|nr:universal stress protein [Mycobacterium sp.]
MPDQPPPSCVVVGIDGSRSAVEAALWAVDEAVSRDLPLRLVYAIDPDLCPGTTAKDRLGYLAAGEMALRNAVTVVESTDKPVKIEAEILQGRPTDVLLEAS